MASVYTECDLSQEALDDLYQKYYAEHEFTHVSKKNIDLKQVVNTNKCLVHVEKHGNKVMILSIVDNLLKGASGQAVQNMNLMFGLDERAGLRLKATAF
jgi:N-acetyl-gamma-glutamyl-phosphate reductase